MLLPLSVDRSGPTLLFSWKWRRFLELARPNLSFGLYLFEESVSLCFLGSFLRIGRPWRAVANGEILESWGIKLFERSLHLSWGAKTKVINLPWDWGSNYRHDVLDASGKLVPVRSWRDEDVLAHKTTHPYRYVLKDGTVQDRTAEIHVEEREWRWRWLQWSPWPRILKRSICVTFSGEVGERTGSWKGGCTGCSYEMKPGETPLETLRRMERERTFD